MQHLWPHMYNRVATLCTETLTSPLTQIMTPNKTGLQKSKRTSAVTWKEGTTQALFWAPGCHTPEEIAATQKKAAEEKKSKEQAMKAKAKKTACDIRHASQLEDALAKESEEVDDAFPCRQSGMFSWLLNANVIFILPTWQLDVKTEVNSELDEESLIQKASKQTVRPSKKRDACC